MAVLLINSPNVLENLLTGTPVEWAQMIASRAALRVLPTAFEVFDNKLEGGPGEGLLISTFRAAYISWVARRYGSSESIVACAADAAKALDAASKAGARNLGRAAFAAIAVRAAAVAESKGYFPAVTAISAAVDAARAASRAALTSSWEAVSADYVWLDQSKSSGRLIEHALWLSDSSSGVRSRAVPEWVSDSLGAFAQRTEGSPFQLIAEWYEAILPDTARLRPESLFGEVADIALATQPDEFWTVTDERTPDMIMVDIVEFVLREGRERAAWDFFLSYSKDDLPAARRISDVLEQAGHSVFSQVNDMTAGKSFVREMNRGLGGMGRLIAVYSPSYFQSGPCQAEWEAAYTVDTSGEAGKIVPFLVQPCDPTPLARRLIWTSLLGLDPAAEKEAILRAVAGTSSPRDRASQRAAVKRSISPDVTLDSSGSRLDVAPNAAIDDPFVDVGLLELPETLRSLIATALDALAGRNAPSGLVHALRSYAAELDARGVNCMTGVLRGQMDFIEAEIDDPDSSDWLTGAGLKKTLKNLRSGHGLLIAHFPLDQARERLIRDIEVSEAKVEASGAYADLELEIARGIEEAFEADLVTEQFRNVSASRQRVARDILEVRTPMVPTSGGEDYTRRERDRALRVEDAKKRALIQQAGFADKTLDVMTKVATLADSPATNRLLKALERLVVWFW
jgi:hypothetical protein